ncbi:MAG TPA: uroporphyrinogen decarboxylase family protein [Thermoguttaceae bacterium]|nr:uroporphyrinogen decarboxylase family protein [Thermoguttaceae bacterium]
MTSRQLVIHTLCHHPVERIARQLEVFPGLELTAKDDLEEMFFRYPTDIQEPEFQYPRGKRCRGNPSRPGRFTDAWGCVWETKEVGQPPELVESPLADLALAPSYKPPKELFEKLSVSQVNRSCAASSRFVLARSDVRPLERLQFLHGAEATRADLACGNRAIRDLLRLVHECYLLEIQWWAKTEVDGVCFRDAWGGPEGLLAPVDLWRDLFKPLYQQYCQLLREQDKYVFFESGGNIAAILEDLVEIGVDAVDCDLGAMNLEDLAHRFRGRITFWGGNPQKILIQGDPAQCRQWVCRIRQALDTGRGGLIGKCLWDARTPFDNLANLMETWTQPLPVVLKALGSASAASS